MIEAVERGSEEMVLETLPGTARLIHNEPFLTSLAHRFLICEMGKQEDLSQRVVVRIKFFNT